jgi:hypothetical protein
MKIITLLLLCLLIPQTTHAVTVVGFSSKIRPSSIQRLTNDITRAASRLRPGASREIVIHLSSEGGILREAARFVDTAREIEQTLNIELNTKVTRSCDSACTVLFTAGTRRYARSSATFGFHAPKIESRLPRGVTAQQVMAAARNLWLGAIARVDLSFANQLEQGRYLYGEDMNEIQAGRVGYGYVTDFVRR